MEPIRHPISTVLEAVRDALVKPGAPSAEYSRHAYVFDGLEWSGEALAQPPFWVVMAAEADIQAESREDVQGTWAIQVWAVQEDLGAEPGSAALGTPPHTPPARAGLLDLLWAALRTLQARGFPGTGPDSGGGYGRLFLKGETETREVLQVSGPDLKTATVRHLVSRALKFQVQVQTALDAPTG